MKRITAFLMALFLLLPVVTVCVSAQESTPDEPEKKTYLYQDKMIEWCAERWNQSADYVRRDLNFYDELYVHINNGEEDWALLKTGFNAAPSNIKIGVNIRSRAVYSLGGCNYFPSGYAVYDTIRETFCDIAEYEKFPDLDAVIEELELGAALGDVDFDGKITVIDATHIQKILAGIEVWEDDQPESDRIHYPLNHKEYFLSDYDQDGMRTVLDATHIQKHLAGIE